MEEETRVDDHRPDDVPDDLTHLGHVDDAVGVAATVGAEEPSIHEPVPVDDPQSAWMPNTAGDLPGAPSIDDTTGPGSWVGGTHGVGLGDPLLDDPYGGEDARSFDPDDGFGPADPNASDVAAPEPIALPVEDDGAPRADAGTIDLPGLVPPDDDPPGEHAAAAIAAPLASLRAFDGAGGDHDGFDVIIEADGDGDPLDDHDGGAGLRLGNDDFDIDALAPVNGAWSAAAVATAIGLTIGVSAKALIGRRPERDRLRARGAAAAVEDLEAAGADAHVEYGDLAALERRLVADEHVLISHIAVGSPEWDERTLRVCAIDREHDACCWLRSTPKAGRPRGAGEHVPSLSMALGVFIASWADSAGEMVVLAGTPESPPVLILPVAVTDALLRPVEGVS